MKILILSNKMPYPSNDGGAIATLSLALSLAKNGQNISILAMNTPKHYSDCNKIPIDIKNLVHFNSVEVNTNIKTAKALKNLAFSKKPYIAERFVSEDFKNKLIEILKQDNFDIVQLEGLYLCSYIDIIRQNSDAKISLRAHNIEHEIWTRIAKNEKNILKKLYKQNLAKRIKKFKMQYLNKYDFLIPITERDASTFNITGNKMPVYVAQTGVDKETYIIENKNTEFPGFFHIGALDWQPNIEGLTWFINNVWSKYKETHREAKFYVAGRNASDSFIRYLKSNSVEFIGEVENANDFINSKSVMIVPLLSGSGMRIKIIEGMAFGKTIITTSIGTEGILTTNNENILIANTPNEFYDCMCKISETKELHNKISENAVNFVHEHFNNQNIANGLIAFYVKNTNQ